MRQSSTVIPYGNSRPALRPFNEAVRKALNFLKLLLSGGRLTGSKVVLVKGFMLLSQPKAGKHRPAKPFGDCEVA
jgi:hypothetical protein